MEICGQLDAPAALPPLKLPQSPSRRGGEEKKSHHYTSAGNRTPVVQPVAWSLY